jgi:hypothetical protein
MSIKNGEFNWRESVSLRDYFETVLRELKEQFREDVRDLKGSFDDKLEAQDKALELAQRIMDKRLDSMNEFREQLKNAEGSFMTRSVYDARHELLQKQVDDLRLKGAEIDGKASQKQLQTTNLMATAALIMAVVAFVIDYFIS